jgi:hypothetical protein
VVRDGARVLRLVASDLDGTLLRSDGSVSERTRRAVQRVYELGIEFVVLTARSPRWVADPVAALGVRGLAVCSNGALVYDLENDRVVARHALEAEAIRRLVLALREAAPGVAFACEREDLSIREPAYEPLWASPDEHARVDALEFALAPVAKLVAQHPELSQAELYELASGLCGTDATATISGERLVEISAAGVTKAFALEQLCAGHGIAAGEVIAFGDMPNDVPLLSWAGRSVAVANAHPDVVAVADEVTASNDEDGVALVLERLG